ncbi:diaminobutyrate--2-oxoglutarate transaminase [Alkalilimnicola ehrlichii]|uniref:Diaminobutyrate--2-oxoglutarate transaminase n=1 Tax=Alkalilimnicola ehrlichii TaxID=351052 RepID=A0A3E0X3G2_9GAMM|nr:diaminobutyrate--2-oxoglutarate transaminase [Alkalilimnicola ehrlichii]RFA39035.1 diaminobutyrate--2-oxoglutarate transaminase [Alkalilimnicola ehrlichii]
MQVIEQYESVVRSYCNNFPTVFEKAVGSCLYDTEGRRYLDFFAGASVLNYGHNHPALKKKLIEYIENDGITHSLDMASSAKVDFLQTFEDLILKPRGMNYKVQFPGPAGTNSVEAALKLARKIKGREKIISFTNAFHGMTLGALSVTGNAFKRSGAGLPLNYSDSMPYCGYFGEDVDTIEYLERFLEDSGSGVDDSAAVIVETIQAEGGIKVAEQKWLQDLQALCRKHDMLFIVDDIQVGCGRTGPFFSFEEAGLDPDIICLSKSLSGYGHPIAVTLLRPELDQWEPGEHNGTFRGNNLAFVTATEAFKQFWADDKLTQEVKAKAELVAQALNKLVAQFPQAKGEVRGRGLLQGIAFENADIAGTVSAVAFENGLIIETSGPEGEVLKLLPPLTITEAELKEGLDIIERSLGEALKRLGISSKEAV